jgi:hypothetical protein
LKRDRRSLDSRLDSRENPLPTPVLPSLPLVLVYCHDISGWAIRDISREKTGRSGRGVLKSRERSRAIEEIRNFVLRSTFAIVSPKSAFRELTRFMWGTNRLVSRDVENRSALFTILEEQIGYFHAVSWVSTNHIVPCKDF